MNKKSIYISVLIVLIALFCSILTPSLLWAETDINGYVLSDLRKDPTFDEKFYPTDVRDHSLSLIQIAEATDDSLLAYVYNPSKDRSATLIRIGLTVDIKYVVKDYTLTELDRHGVFIKYKVNDLELSKKQERFYDIICLFRAFDKDIDKNEVIDNTVNQVPFAVEKYYKVSGFGEDIKYECEKSESVVITSKWCGHLRYDDGLNFYKKACDAFFVAFSTNRNIDRLYEVDIKFSTREYVTVFAVGLGTETEYTEYKEQPIKTLHDSDEGSTNPNGLFGKKHEWKVIQTVDEFKAQEDLKNESNLDNKQFVLRFFEADYTLQSFPGSTRREGTEVGEISLLRLKFREGIKTYDLGVIDNYQTPDNDNDNNNDNELKTPIDDIKYWWDGVKDWWDNMISTAKIVLIVFVSCLILAVVLKLIDFIVNLFRKKKRSDH